MPILAVIWHFILYDTLLKLDEVNSFISTQPPAVLLWTPRASHTLHLINPIYTIATDWNCFLFVTCTDMICLSEVTDNIGNNLISVGVRKWEKAVNACSSNKCCKNLYVNPTWNLQKKRSPSRHDHITISNTFQILWIYSDVFCGYLLCTNIGRIPKIGTLKGDVTPTTFNHQGRLVDCRSVHGSLQIFFQYVFTKLLKYYFLLPL